MERRQDIVRAAQSLVELFKLHKNGLLGTLRAAGRNVQTIHPLKLIFQHNLSIDLKRFATLAAGFKVEAFFHCVGGFQSFRFEGVLLRG